MEQFCSQAYTSSGLITIGNHTGGDLFTYILKGYPDALKKRLITEAVNSADCGCRTLYDYNGLPFLTECSEKGFLISDSDLFKPETCGITDTLITPYPFLNRQLIESRRDRALFLFSEIKKEEKRLTGFISAARSLAADCRKIEKQSLNTSYINRFTFGLWKQYGCSPTGKIGKETKYFADVLTSDGIDFPFEKFSGYCTRVSAADDFSSVIAESVADKIRLYALSCGLDVISFVDFLDARTVRHIIVPELKYGIYCERMPCDGKISGVKRMRRSRFFNREKSEHFRNRISFCRKAFGELIKEAEKLLKKTEMLKKQLDEIYLSAADCDGFIKENLSRICNN